MNAQKILGLCCIIIQLFLRTTSQDQDIYNDEEINIVNAVPGTLNVGVAKPQTFDKNGYIAYCPCMGRFGNQADHFLGVLGFAKGLNRTLILPPWIEYIPYKAGSIQIPFDNYFQVEPLLEYHRVITMESFMENIAHIIWPPGKRIGFCYSFRNGNSCKMKEGNPFGPFWDHFDINFDLHEAYGPLGYNTHLDKIKAAWEKKYPPTEFKVLAFSGAPAVFPVAKENKELHRYLKWSQKIDNLATEFINKELPEGNFIGIHLRHGSDWIKACDHVLDKYHHFFASPQCLGYNFEFGHVSNSLCKPSKEEVIKQVKNIAKKIKAKSVFVATDDNTVLLDNLTKSLKSLKIKVVQHFPVEPHVDLAILAKSTHYIGNCLSSFSSFAKRERDTAGKPSSFWNFLLISTVQIQLSLIHQLSIINTLYHQAILSNRWCQFLLSPPSC